MKAKIRLSNVLRQRFYLVGILFFIVSVSLFSTLFFFNNKILLSAPVNGDVRCIASGSWSTLSIWQKYSGGTWIPATLIPSIADNIITIQTGYTVTVTAALTVDQLVIQSGAVLSLNSGIAITLRKSSAPDMQVYGIFRNAGTVTITAGTSITYYNGGSYQHNYTTTAGVIPVGVWNAGSVCEIMGYTTNTAMPAGMNQSFDIFKWNCTSQVADVNFAGGLTTFIGNFQVESTGANAFAATGTNQLFFSSNNLTLGITGDILINGGTLTLNGGLTKTTTINQTGNIKINGGKFKLNAGSTSTATINLTGNITQTGGVFELASGLTSNSTINISGDLSLSGGAFNFVSGTTGVGTINLTGNYLQTSGSAELASGTTATGTINVSGDFTHSGGTIAASGLTATGKFVFSKSGSQNFTSSGNTVTGSVDYTVNSGSTLNMGTSAILGRNFTLNSGGELGIGSPNGISSSGSSGNIQVSGTRTFNPGGYYLYNGTGIQVTGTGLPSTINTLTINNNSYVTLTAVTTASNVLNMLSGKIITGTNEMIVTNTSAAAITGNLTSSWVIGNLRRTITGSSTFAYPVGSIISYELMNVTTSGIVGVTSMVGSFVNAATNDTAYPLAVTVNSVELTEMLDHGYWTLLPFGTRTAGTYSVQVNETGYSNMISAGTFYSLVSRNNTTSPWQSVGIHTDSTQSVSGTTVRALRSGLTGFYQFGIALGDLPSLANPTLISGTAGTPGATYLFQDAMRGIDMWTKIRILFNGATLTDIDNAASGYNESFQPFVNFPANKDSYIEWEIIFKKANTSVDTTLNKITATGVDVDGSSNIREYIIATMPTSYSLDPATVLTMSNDSGRYKALSSTTTISNIDTSHHEAMYQLNYNNVNTIIYRTGAVNTSSSSQTRQTSLYFRSFLIGAPVFALPIKLVEFKASPKNDKVLLDWITATETNNDYFTVERSNDGINFKTLFTKRGAGNSTTTRYYEMTDENPLEGQSYYRLKQTDYDGKFTYSKFQAVKIGKNPADANLVIESVSPNPFQSDLQIEFSVKSKGSVQITLLNTEGKSIESKKMQVEEGRGSYQFEQAGYIKPGIYFIVIEQDGQRLTRKIIKN